MVLIAGAVAGCANSNELKARFNGRWGPDPAMQPADVATVAQNQLLVLSYLERSAGYMAADGTLIRPLVDADYAEIAQWGFNIGRQDCEIYMDNLFRLSREKGRNDNILAAASTAAAAIVTEAPGLVAKKVSDLQEVFRNSVVTGQVKVTSPASAYYAVQSYYHICLPHSIEGVMLQSIADSGPVTPAASGGGSSSGAGGGRGPAPTTAMRTPELR
jgi:hypothetical protein